MDWFHALVLGIVQGVTEFLPISSSGHLILLPRLLAWPDQGLSFDVAVNTGSLVALVGYFHKEVYRLVTSFFATLRRGGWHAHPEGRLAWWLGIGTIPVGLAGLTFKDQVETAARNPLIIATTSILFGLLLWYADQRGKQARTLESIGIGDALLVGCAQALALIPGTSRSGITMTAGLMMNLNRESAARFSFLLAIPVSVLAGGLELIEWVRQSHSLAEWLPMAIGFFTSGISAFLVIHWLLYWIRSRSMTIFVVYRVILGLALFIIF
ncbi:MAG: undecaprenyl-diphosphate phosphatase [Magnetococcales bacterium]|nr:undecaprenyl-diphosphate phosphatase [Magnetococcales bacterium]